jgi:hypothetical protein
LVRNLNINFFILISAGNRKNKYDMERQQILDQELHRDHKHISDFSDRRSNNNKSVFRLSTLKGDEGLGQNQNYTTVLLHGRLYRLHSVPVVWT